jgi:hypothetical protein
MPDGSFPAGPGPIHPGLQEDPQEVTVTAVEVPVRVFAEGRVVRGLTAADFEVYENGLKQEITHFEIISGTPTDDPSLCILLFVT